VAYSAGFFVELSSTLPYTLPIDGRPPCRWARSVLHGITTIASMIGMERKKDRIGP
jgi:hypothetical protein